MLCPKGSLFANSHKFKKLNKFFFYFSPHYINSNDNYFSFYSNFQESKVALKRLE